MTDPRLVGLLFRIRDQVAGAEELALAVALLRDADGLPDELRGVLDDPSAEERASSADGLLFVLGEVEGLLGAALREAAGPVRVRFGVGPAWKRRFVERRGDAIWRGHRLGDAVRRAAGVGRSGDPAWDLTPAVLAAVAPVSVGVLDELVHSALVSAVYAEAGRFESRSFADEVLMRIGAGPEIGIVRALHAEAGTVDIAGAVFRALGFAELPLAEAVVEAAGRVDVAGAVMARLGAPSLALAEAVEAEAGEIDVADDVLRALGASRIAAAVRAEAGPTPELVDAVMARVRHGALAPTPVPARAANRGGWIAMLAAAAAAVFAVVGFQEFGAPTASPMLQFADASEIVVDDLQYGDNATVQVLQADDEALIIWVDEGATL